jgi:protein-disulfide isomerase
MTQSKTPRPVQAPKPVSKRKSAERKPPPVGAGGRIPRRWLYVGAGVVAVAVAAILIVVSLTGGGDEAPPIAVAGEETQQLLEGIPQDANELGSPDAPVTLVEFADLQCPFCQRWSSNVLPTLIDEYVRSGELRIIFRGIAFLGPDSSEALRYAYSAGEQNKLWNVVELTYQQQGPENSDWVTPELMRGIGEAVPGLDVPEYVGAIDSDAVGRELDKAGVEAQAAGIQGTPTFLVGPTGGELAPLEYESLTSEVFTGKIDEALTSAAG